MVWGYCRCSTAKQKIDRQKENILRQFPTAKLVCEFYTGRIMHRPEWEKLLKKLQRGDIVVFDEVSRMSRNAEEGFALYEELYNEGIELHFLKEPHIDTTVYTTAMGKDFMMTGTSMDYILDGLNKYRKELVREQIRLAFVRAEQEVELIRERTKEGIREAHIRGSVSGHPVGTTFETKKSKECKKIIKKHSIEFGGTLADVDVIKLCGCARGSYYKYKKELLEEIAIA